MLIPKISSTLRIFQKSAVSSLHSGSNLQMISKSPLIFVGVPWFISSALFSTWANTTFLKYFSSPLLHVFIRFSGSALFGMSTLLLSKADGFQSIPKLLGDVLVPAALLWIANFANSSALSLSGITLTYVMKACIPVFTVLICALRGQRFSLMTYLSLIPTVCGVALASASDMEFSAWGLMAALVSALAQTLMNISIKEVRSSTGYDSSTMLAAMTTVCTILTLPVIALSSGVSAPEKPDIFMILSTAAGQTRSGQLWPAFLIVANAIAFHIEYVLNVLFVGFVSPVTFSVSDVSRRLAIIISGAAIFGKTLSTLNCAGIALALSGVLFYSYSESLPKPAGMNTAPKTMATAIN
eukprot:gene2896-5687_t